MESCNFFDDCFAKIDSAIILREDYKNKKADEATQAIRKVTDYLVKKGFNNFVVTSDVDLETGHAQSFDVHTFSAALHWFGGKIMYSFEDEDPEPVLGLKREIRILILESLLEKFMNRALEIVEKAPLSDSVSLNS